MSLKEYKSKRNFKKSQEPLATKKPSSKNLHFCIQKHDARRLHYDLRLEYKGILLSWAIPKGPSLNPHDKRLAIKVEDHPLEYQYFEGVIPKGNYGAGTVEIWDRGTYTVPEGHTLEESEKIISKGLKSGHLHVHLNGEKLNGLFVLQKLNLKTAVQDNAWLLIKKTDAYASSQTTEPVTPQKDKTKKNKMADFIAPMLATLIKQPFDDEDWLFEIKWDGWRTLAFIDEGKVQLKSRTNHIWNEKFPSIVKELKSIDNQVIFDGEIVVLDSKGRSHFQLLQNYQASSSDNLFYYVFDLLYASGKDLRDLPLIERKEILKKYLADLNLPSVRYSDHILKNGISCFKMAKENELEGIIGKKLTSTYQSKRASEWVKIKTILRQEVVIGGFTAPRGSRKKFGALLVGVYNDKKELVYAGHVGGGFDSELLKDIYSQLELLIQTKCPFKVPAKPNSPVTWVKPKLVCEVSFSEWTEDNVMRQPIFQGLRMDKPATAVRKEIPKELPSEVKTKTKAIGSKKSNEPTLSHLEKYYWPKEKITKRDLIEYYRAISPYILPYLKNRPIMLHRYPDGIEGKDFYQKDLTNLSPPSWIKTCPIEQEGKINRYLVINDLRSLLYAVNLGSIDLHPFHAKCTKLENPDYCVIDLDPHDIPLDKLIETALLFHEILDSISVKNYIKTSGGKGLHILIPLHGKYTYEQSRQFAEVISTLVHEKLPDITSLERSPKKRPNKIYLDCMQNRISQGIAAPYSVRPRANATVSTPLNWDEVNSALDPSHYTLKNIPERLQEKGDIFKPILGPGVNIQAALKKLQNNF